MQQSPRKKQSSFHPVCWVSHLADKTERNPLIVRVVHHVLALPLPRALALVGRRDVEAGVHPAVGLKRPLTHPTSGLSGKTIQMRMNEGIFYQVTLNRLSEKLIGGHDEGSENKEGGGVSVEEPECPVIY